MERLHELERALTAPREEEALAAKEVSELQRLVRQVHKATSSRAPQLLKESLFVHLFSAFDTFVGDLLSALFEKRTELFSGLDKQVSFKEMLKSGRLDSVKESVLSAEIETIRRLSYLEQFKWIERFFDIKIREWKEWPAFIEASQRRNLYVHANGIVSEQYLTVCADSGYKFSQSPEIGERLPLKDRYFNRVSELVFDAGVQLGHTLWRKVLVGELEYADDALISLIYDCLLEESWSDARRTAVFFISQRRFSNDLSRRIGLINLAIAYKFSGSKEYISLLQKEDWSAAIGEFSLAIAVLNDDFKAAARAMKAIGKSGHLINELHYHEWPLLKEFRKSTEFLEAFFSIYGKDFIRAAEEVAHESVVDGIASMKEGVNNSLPAVNSTKEIIP